MSGSEKIEVHFKINDKINTLVIAESKKHNISKSEFLNLIVENYFRDKTIQAGNAELKSIIREYNDNLASISENLKKLAGDSEMTKNYIRMFFEELTGVYDLDDLDGNDFKN